MSSPAAIGENKKNPMVGLSRPAPPPPQYHFTAALRSSRATGERGRPDPVDRPLLVVAIVESRVGWLDLVPPLPCHHCQEKGCGCVGVGGWGAVPLAPRASPPSSEDGVTDPPPQHLNHRQEEGVGCGRIPPPLVHRSSPLR